MKKAIQTMSAMLAMLALVCVSSVSFTACSDDDEPVEEVTYSWEFKETSPTTPDFMDDKNKIETVFKTALGASDSATSVTKQGTAEQCDREVLEACQQAFNSLKGETWQGRYVFMVNNMTTGVTICMFTFDADDSYNASDLKIGDYYYSDGTWSDGGLREINDDGMTVWVETMPESGKTVIGIVFQTDKSRIGDAEKVALGGEDKVHGLVMSVKNAATDLKWSLEYRDFGELTNCKTREQCNADINGLYNYNTVIDYAEGEGKLSSYPAFEAVDKWNAEDNEHKAPENTTGWYLPAVGQWYDFFRNLGGLSGWNSASESGDDYSWSGQSELVSKVNACFSPLGDGNYDAFMPDNSSQYFWSSSEYSGDYARYWDVYSDSYVRCLWRNKRSHYGVRPILAF